MSEVKTAGPKKKSAVSADQFEDADEEETEEFPKKTDEADAAADPKPKEVEPKAEETNATPTPAKKPELVQAALSSEEEKEIVAATSKKKKTTKKKTTKKTDTGAVKESTKKAAKRSASASPNRGKDGASPLDALATACVAAEQPKAKLAPPKPPKGGTKVKAEDISCTDVLCGRGGQSNHHPGNIFFRRLVRAKQEEYLKANKREKTVVAKDIVKLIRMLSPHGRFLKKDPKDESVYVDVGDVQARNKASQALREGAPELREELRDQHRLNAQNGGGPEVKLPYHGNRGSVSSPKNDEERAAMSRKEREAIAARAAVAQGLMLPPFGPSPEQLAAAARLRGQAGPPEGSDDEAEGKRAGVSAAVMQAAAEERARHLMLAGGPHGLGAAHLLNPHLGLGGLGAMNPFMAGHSSAAAAQLQAAAALQAAGGSHLLSPQALMMAAAAGQPSAAAMLHASRARELAGHMGAANYAAAAGMNPLFLGAHARAGQVPFQDTMRMHELMSSAGNVNASGIANGSGAGAGTGNGNGNGNGKREREGEEAERETDEKYAKAAKLSRQYL